MRLSLTEAASSEHKQRHNDIVRYYMSDSKELREIFEERSQTYLFLSQIFYRELSTEVIEQLAHMDYRVESENENLKQGYRLLHRFFSFCENDARTQLAVEYARIFLSAGVYTENRQIAAPYESVFTSPERLMMQEARDDVYQIYLRDGFSVNPDRREPDDHLAFELEYLANLSSRTVIALEQDDVGELFSLVEKQSSFIAQHLLNWLPPLREAAGHFAQLTFYIGMLLVTEGYLQEDLKLLHELKTELSVVSATT